MYNPAPVPRKRPRLTSLSGFGFGAGWDWVATDGEIVRRLLVFLEDRRALAYEHYREDIGYVVQSVLQIRDELVKTLQALTPDSGANRSVRALRGACVAFLDRVDGNRPWGYDPEFLIALGELRGIFALYVRALAEQYQMEIHGPLARLLLAADLGEDTLDAAATSQPGLSSSSPPLDGG